ncbi:MAG: SpoIIE family protein phosphatase [Anaerovoracaceae bacterium]
MGVTLIRMTTATILPVLMAALFYLSEKKKTLGSMEHKRKQLLIGICFGMLAVMATEFGIPVDGAMLNVRNAAPLTAGLIFGWPSGIIAGLIGGAERWFSDAGDFTRTACSIATVIAGLLGASVRKFMMDNKKASWFYGLAVGVTSEVLHMLLIFLTNTDEMQRAFLIVKKCAFPMIAANGLSVMFAIMAVAFLTEKKKVFSLGREKIAQTFQRWLLICVLLAFGITTVFTYFIQTNLAKATADYNINISIQDVKKDIRDASDNNLLSITNKIAEKVDRNPDGINLVNLLEEYDVTEINIVDKNGIIIDSTCPEFIGYDMGSGEQSAEFMPLITGTKQIVQDYGPTTYDPDILRKYAGAALENGGFVQVGYDAQQFQKSIDNQVADAAKNRHIGQNGYVLICNEEGTILSDRYDHERKNISMAEASNYKNQSGKGFFAEIYGVESYCMFIEAEGYYIVGVLEKSEAFFSRDVSVYILVFMETIVFAMLFAHIYFLIKKLVVENIQQINSSLGEITGGNLDVVVDVRTNEEFASLSDDINSTVVALKHYIDEAAARIDKELEFAKKIQHATLPSVFPPYPNRKDFDIYASMDTAKEVGGDFYDFYLLGENRLAFLIADVSGKGIPAAMFMMTAKTLIKGFAEGGIEVNEVFTRANAKLCEGNEADMFVTAWMGILDLQTGVLNYANAGHNPPIIKHRDGEFEYLKSKPNFVLAGMEGINYKKFELQLEPGDVIFLYTDGVTEAQNKDESLFGEDALLESLNEIRDKDVTELCRKVKADVDTFTGEAEQFDDITMLCVKFNGMENGASITMEPSMETVPKVAEFVEEQLTKAEVPAKILNKLLIATDEIYSNIVRYSGADCAKIQCVADKEKVKLVFSDNGKPYNPLETEEPDVTASAEERGIGGLGIFMVRKMMDSADYMYMNEQNILTLIMNI